MTDTYSDGTPVRLLPENDEDDPHFGPTAADIRRRARTQAIEECIKVVREREVKWRAEGRTKSDEHGDATLFMHIENAAAEIASRLEALKTADATQKETT